jgi:cytochrome c
MKFRPILAAAACAALAQSAIAIAADDRAAEAIAKKSGCLKCHAVSAKKEASSFKDIAAKYKGKPGAEATLATHLTTNAKVKVDGREEAHDNLKTKDDAEVKNVVQWILSR